MLLSPAKSDLQQVHVVIRDKDKQEAITMILKTFTVTCPVLMVFLGDSRRIRRIYRCEISLLQMITWTHF